jgi:hypothetical protein
MEQEVPVRTPTSFRGQLERVGSDHGVFLCLLCGLLRFGQATLTEVTEQETLGRLVGPCIHCGKLTSRGIGLDRIHNYAEK